MKEQGKLTRSLGLFSTVILVISSVIGSGIYKKVAPMSFELQDPQWVLICWVVAGVVSLLGALSNAEVASLLANSGGEYSYYRTIYNKFFGFLYGWSNFFVIRTGSFASIAYVFAMSVNNLVPLPRFSAEIEALSLWGVFNPLENFGVKGLTIALIWFLTAINYRGLDLGKAMSNISMTAILLCVGMIIVLGLSISGGSWEHFSQPAKAYQPVSWLDPLFIQSFFAASLAAFWGYEGWSTVGYMGSEIKNPQRNLPLAIIMGISGVIVLYFIIHLTYLYVLPIDSFIEIYENKNSIAAVEVVKSFLGNGGGVFMSLLIILTTFNCTHVTMLMASRLYYTMAHEGMFFRKADFIHPKFNSPSISLIYQAFWATVLILSGSFEQLTDMLIFASFIFYGATTYGVFVLRKKMPDAPRNYKVWGYPIVPILFIIFCVALVGITIFDKPREAFIGLGLMATAVPYWYWNKRKANGS